jgi:hypothetical protein
MRIDDGTRSTGPDPPLSVTALLGSRNARRCAIAGIDAGLIDTQTSAARHKAPVMRICPGAYLIALATSLAPAQARHRQR